MIVGAAPTGPPPHADADRNQDDDSDDPRAGVVGCRRTTGVVWIVIGHVASFTFGRCVCCVFPCPGSTGRCPGQQAAATCVPCRPCGTSTPSKRPFAVGNDHEWTPVSSRYQSMRGRPKRRPARGEHPEKQTDSVRWVTDIIGKSSLVLDSALDAISAYPTAPRLIAPAGDEDRLGRPKLHSRTTAETRFGQSLSACHADGTAAGRSAARGGTDRRTGLFPALGHDLAARGDDGGRVDRDGNRRPGGRGLRQPRRIRATLICSGDRTGGGSGVAR